MACNTWLTSYLAKRTTKKLKDKSRVVLFGLRHILIMTNTIMDTTLEAIFGRNKSVSFSNEMYELVADFVSEKLDGDHYASFMISIENVGKEGIEVELEANLFIHRTPFVIDPVCGPYGGEIDNVIPIWWTCSTFDEDGEQTDNDFDFSNLIDYLIEVSY